MAYIRLLDYRSSCGCFIPLKVLVALRVMRVVIFFVCLCYLLLGGYNYLYTGSHHTTYSAALHFEKSYTKFTDKKQGYPAVKDAANGEEGAYIIPEIVEDETDRIASRKYKLLASYTYALSGTFLLTWLYSRFKTPRRSYNLLTNKYITQRVLRI